MAEIAWEHVDSSNVERVAYHDETETLCVKFRSGAMYTYAGVSFNSYMSLVGADSVGRYLNSVIKGLHHYQRFETEHDLLSSL